jgi:uncharacterized membrane protein
VKKLIIDTGYRLFVLITVPVNIHWLKDAEPINYWFMIAIALFIVPYMFYFTFESLRPEASVDNKSG